MGELPLHVTVRDDRPLSAPFTLTVSVPGMYIHMYAVTCTHNTQHGVVVLHIIFWVHHTHVHICIATSTCHMSLASYTGIQGGCVT